MTAPKFSVLIPSKDRLELLAYAIDSVLRQGFDDLEVIVSDNASSTPYAATVDGLGDPRIHCVRFDDPVPVTRNWNHALSLATSEYVVMLGDDDALAPRYFEVMSEVIAKFDQPDVVHLAGYLYCYPGAVPSLPDGDFCAALTSPLFVGRYDPYVLDRSEAARLAQKGMDMHQHYPFNSQNFLWKRSAMARIARSGEFFRSPYPDFFAAMMTFLNAQTIVVYPHPQIIIGVSQKSFGYYFNGDQQAAGSAFLGHAPASELLADPDVLPGSEHNTKWLLAAKEVRTAMGNGSRLRVGVKNYRRLQIVDLLRRGGPGSGRKSLAPAWPRLHPDERLLANGLLTAFAAARVYRPSSQGGFILSRADRLLDQHFPPEITRLPIGSHRTILDAVSWLEGPKPPDGPLTSAVDSSVNPYLSIPQQRLLDEFHDLYYSLTSEGKGVGTIALNWLGVPLFKCPMDLWLYQEIVASQRPDVIVETGTYRGGSAHYLATLCQLVGHGRVVTVDINAWGDEPRPQHDRLTYLTGSSVDPDIVSKVRSLVGSNKRVLVILDSDHTCDHVLAELRAYQGFVPVGGLIVVEDTNVNGHPTYPDHGPGPWEAVDAFLKENHDFIADRGMERFLLTMNPRGYLRRVT